jgi:hypothetical protein
MTAFIKAALAALTLAGCATTTPPTKPLQTHATVGDELIPCEDIGEAARMMMWGRQMGEEQEFFADQAAHSIQNLRLYYLMMEILDQTYVFSVQPTASGKKNFVDLHQRLYLRLCQQGEYNR